MWRPWTQRNPAETIAVPQNTDVLSGPEDKPENNKQFSSFKCNQCNFNSKRFFNLQRHKNRFHVQKENTRDSKLVRNINKLKKTTNPQDLIDYVTAAAAEFLITDHPYFDFALNNTTVLKVIVINVYAFQI